MPKVYINYEAFELIERRGKITARELAKHIGVKESSAATWLSKWAKRGYLTWVPRVDKPKKHTKKPGRPIGSGGSYRLGEKWWGGLAYDVNKDQG